ncbi:TPA: acylneuraminate cytidylyltransferase family protein, partial [Vibrio cholerae]
MINGRRVLALIPARGGSKRLPRKNILPLAGKPLIAWSIEAAQNSQYIDEIFVSTDNEEIAKIASQFGVNIPELRPESLASDTAKTESVLFYTLDNFAKDTDIVVLLQPTSPLRTAEHIDEALRLFFQKEAFSVVSVTECEHSPLWANVLSSDHSMENFIEKGAKQRSQDLGVYYR